MRERDIERKLIQAVRQSGGLTLKFVSPNLNGVPDRLLLFPGGRVAFAEVKAPGEKPRPLQVHRMEQLRALGFWVYVVDGEEKIGEMIHESMVEDAVLRIMEEEQAINEEIDRLVETKRQIREVIGQVGDVTCRLLLEKRNLLFETWPKICVDLKIGKRWAQTRHKDAVGMVQEILDRMGR